MAPLRAPRSIGIMARGVPLGWWRQHALGTGGGARTATPGL